MQQNKYTMYVVAEDTKRGNCVRTSHEGFCLLLIGYKHEQIC